MVGMVDKMENKLKNTSSWSSLEAKFYVQAFEIAKKLDLQRPPLVKNIAMLTALSIIQSMLEALHQRNCECSVNPGWWLTNFLANRITPFP